MQNTSLLTSHDFCSLSLNAINGCLEFDVTIGPKARKESYLFPFDGTGEDNFYAALSVKRPSTRIVLNPHEYSSHELLSVFSKLDPIFLALAQKLNVLQEPFSKEWSSNPTDRLVNEGQSFLLVCFDGKQPVGFASFDAYIQTPLIAEGSRPITQLMRLTVNCMHAYVTPTARQSGFAIDMSIASSWLARDILIALEKAYPFPHLIETNVQICDSATANTSKIMGTEFQFSWKVKDCFAWQIRSQLETTYSLLNKQRKKDLKLQ